MTFSDAKRDDATAEDRSRHLSASSRQSASPTPPPSPPPWRSALGRAFFLLNSSFAHVSGENIANGANGDRYLALLKKSFRAYSDIPVGSDVLVEHAFPHGCSTKEIEWEVDIVPARGLLEGDQDIQYDLTGGRGDESPPIKAGNTRQVCWNCLAPGHSHTSCPQPRNHLLVRIMRDKFLAEKESMPTFAIPYMNSYSVTDEDKIRRLDLVDRFDPGRVSNTLADALFWIDPTLLRLPDETPGDKRDLEDGEVSDDFPERDQVLEIRGMRRRRAWPWINEMVRWGYPPGWIASKDPMIEVKRRIQQLPISTGDESEDDESDMLQVYGGIGSPLHLGDEAARSSASSSSPRSMSASSSSSSSSTSKPLLSPTQSVSSNMMLSPIVDPEPLPLLLPPQSCDQSAPPQPEDAIPPPPDQSATPPPPPPPNLPPPLPLPVSAPSAPRAQRWAKYDTDMFDSDRLKAFTTARPLPLGY
ncbi:hypothetical protein BD324DRAFT_468822 [Kockovaella imperatae]|uniref:CCHC-type domain-containing protein n=1 Tax=Kockovaella imperatae TaxID=4999 RepID=A0A1Y1UGX9_9TREE|nr:hypothetical protein BD324DRAFT_468822 [Kockovaella imperatae]ORX36787.1 hypothetical protein BD324DRAFT_468822 [Kockovaella imperatae]